LLDHQGFMHWGQDLYRSKCDVRDNEHMSATADAVVAVRCLMFLYSGLALSRYDGAIRSWQFARNDLIPRKQNEEERDVPKQLGQILQSLRLQ
jgi:hypothetical protein